MFGLGFSEIMIVVIIAILFLGPDKLPSAMVDVAKFFRNAKKTIGDVKDSLEQEMNVADIKEEALAYKKQLLDAQDKLAKVTDTSQISANLTSLTDDFLEGEEIAKKKDEPKSQKVAFEDKSQEKEVKDV